MLSRQILIVLALAAVTSGCDSPVSNLVALHQEKIQSLEFQLQEQAAAKAVEIEFYEQQASVAAGCDWLIPVCPDSMAEPGRDAQANGYGGATRWPFWLFLVLKASLGVTIAGALLLLVITTFSRSLRALEADNKKAILEQQCHQLHLLIESIDAVHGRITVLEGKIEEVKIAYRQSPTAQDDGHFTPQTRPRTLDDL